jgi:malate synthase
MAPRNHGGDPTVLDGRTAEGPSPRRSTPEPARVRSALPAGTEGVLSVRALEFLAAIHREFDESRRQLLAQRGEMRRILAAGREPRFPRDTAEIRAGTWRVPGPPADLVDRRVEITGPVGRKMIINALNSGARVFMADFEDAHSPTWSGCLRGQINLRDAV